MEQLSELVLKSVGLVHQAEMRHVAISAVVFGILLHVTILRTFPIDEYIYSFLAILCAAPVVLAFSYIFDGFTTIETLTRVSVVSASSTAGVFLSIFVYRVLFHPLRHFPGPFLAKVSRFYSASLAAKEVQYYRHVAQMHEQYGDFIRTGPREICVIRKSAVALIYGPGSDCLKSTWYTQVDTDYRQCSVHMTREIDAHRRRRKAWDRGLAIKALNTYEPRIKPKVDDFVSHIAKSGRPVDATAWAMYLTFDVMGEVGFGQDFQCVATETEHPAIKGVHDSMTVLSVLAHVPWLLNILSRIPGATAGYAPFLKWCGGAIEAKLKEHNVEEDPQDISSWLCKAYLEHDISAAPSAAALHEDARVIVVAGSDTTGTTLVQALFYMSRHPRVLRKLQALVDAAMPKPSDWTYEKAKSITYIDDIITETLRLKPAVLTGGFRVTSEKGIQVDEQYIPGNTNVFVPIQRIQTDPRYWQEAGDFIPERWGEKRDEMETEGAPYMPFALGAYICPGKNLAFMTLRIALSRIAQEFDVSLAPGETGKKFDMEAKDTFSTTLPPLMVEFKPRN